MNNVLKNGILLLFLVLVFHTIVFSENSGHISGTLLLDDSWERRVYLSFVETLEKEFVVSNQFIIASAVVDSLGHFKIELDKAPTKWSLLRLHVVKKGVSPNSLVIGSRDENFYFLIARRNSKIKLFNTAEKPLFKNTLLEGAPYMNTFEYIRKLANYPNSIDYENSIIEKEFIKEVVSEKLKVIADTSINPLVSLYALYQTDFHSDYYQDPNFYESFFSKWENETSSYFESFRSKLPITPPTAPNQNFHPKYTLFLTSFGVILFIGFYVFRNRNPKINQLSVQERKIFDLVRNGLSNKEISTECNIELTTVKSHVSSIYSKMGIKSRKEAINLKVK